MAILSKKENKEETTDLVTETTATTPVEVKLDARASSNLVVPRISEKAGHMEKLNKYVFTVWGKANKVEVRKIVEKLYGVKIDRVNMITMAGHTRRFGRNYGVTKSYKKAIVTLTPNSKKIDLVEPS